MYLDLLICAVKNGRKCQLVANLYGSRTHMTRQASPSASSRKTYLRMSLKLSHSQKSKKPLEQQISIWPLAVSQLSDFIFHMDSQLMTNAHIAMPSGQWCPCVLGTFVPSATAKSWKPKGCYLCGQFQWFSMCLNPMVLPFSGWYGAEMSEIMIRKKLRLNHFMCAHVKLQKQRNDQETRCEKPYVFQLGTPNSQLLEP